MPFQPALAGRAGIPDAWSRLQITSSPEVALNQKANQKLKKLIEKLGEAIHESVSESEHIAGVVKNIREQGFDVLLMLEATIGLNEVEDESVEAATESEAVEGPFTSNDLNFLRSLRISVPLAEEAESSSEPRSLMPPPQSDSGLDSHSEDEPSL